MEPVKVGLLGLGTVGGGTINLLQENAEEIMRRAGRGIEVIHAAARDLNKPRICDTEGIALTTDPNEVVDNPDVDVILELIGGEGLARDAMLRAIENGKHIVTANKALIAKHGNEIFAAAEARGVMVAFEAAVAGGIPIIKGLREGLAANRIEWLAGIINGTGNFILTEMRDEDRDFADVLAEAQRLGYAEADPTFDVEGIDAAHKLAIMASIAFGMPLKFDSVYTEGITHVTRDDVTFAEELGYRIKHLGIARRTWNGIELRVHPTLIPERQLIANVDGVMNAVVVKGNMVGPTLYYGAGAGAEPTASAVVADLIDVVRALSCAPESRVPHLGVQPQALADESILAMDEVETAYYLRMQVVDRPGVLADLTRTFADLEISIEAVVQKEPPPGESLVTIILLTRTVQEIQMVKAMEMLGDMDAIFGDVTRIRLEYLQ
ncbi:homoserine dehydrogenase [Thiohalomonas denitrificans]|uniref:homoserine dehydrogenase n=1 Tax=Thiohalomonas denitrificans TaxID=415747 RepID=UPI0026E969CF|nr:homoserine dehydrogenase [Thiohalomonas denitrificans]